MALANGLVQLNNQKIFYLCKFEIPNGFYPFLARSLARSLVSAWRPEYPFQSSLNEIKSAIVAVVGRGSRHGDLFALPIYLLVKSSFLPVSLSIDYITDSRLISMVRPRNFGSCQLSQHRLYRFVLFTYPFLAD